MKKKDFIKMGTISGMGIASLPNLAFSSHQEKKLKRRTMDYSVQNLQEASYVIETPKGLRCLICPNECTLKEGELSDCKNRKVIDGKLYTLAYNHPCTIHIDPIEKKPLLHYKPGVMAFSLGTAGCNFSCLNCQNSEISQVSPEQIRSFRASPTSIVEGAIKENCPTIAYTYTEPISYFEYMLDTAKIAKEAGIDNLMISNGYINEEPLRELAPYLNAANIDLKVFDDLTYQRLTGGKLAPVLRTLEILRDNGVWIEITNLIVPEWSDDLKLIDKMCKWLAKNGFKNYPLHFSRFHATYKLKHLPSTPLEVLLEARNIAKKHGIIHVYIGNVPEIDGENTLCPECQKIVIRRKGYQILSNKIKDSSCPFCQTSISGVWA